MKKCIFIIALFATHMAAVAQTVNVHFKNGQTINYPSNNVDYVDFSAKASDPTLTAGAAVDLGLSVYWASCNLGAERPEEYGEYYAWGETKPKSSYTQDNYSYYDKNTEQYIDIGSNIGGTQYDAATVNLGSDWRMPTEDNIRELIIECTLEWTQIAGVNGIKVTGKNGNSVFLPKGFYWISELLPSVNARAREFEAYTGGIGIISGPRQYGNPIRPVTSNPNAGK